MLKDNKEFYTEIESIANIFGGKLELKTILEFADGSVVSYGTSINTNKIILFYPLDGKEQIDFDLKIKVNIKDLAAAAEKDSGLFINHVCFVGSRTPTQDCPPNVAEISRTIRASWVLYKTLNIKPFSGIFKIFSAVGHVFNIQKILESSRKYK